ncbi:MAG: DNA mismatch repair protein MutT [Rhizobiales bacterium 62-17]|nr:NUDIX domain-containing protein [Hyphomicrobiales bacterium]OJY05366.1 MAG: DNA mismatch repair protein MutT [Rhizobiales bacterium 62-17]
MTLWRPPSAIRVKVLGLVWRDKRLLAAEVETDTGLIKGVRPLGGSVEYGESREQALHREFREELGTAIAIHGPWHVFENIFTHEGALGHEIVFAADVELADRTLYQRDEITFAEDNGLISKARWIDLDELKRSGVALYPEGLADYLAALPRQN